MLFNFRLVQLFLLGTLVARLVCQVLALRQVLSLVSVLQVLPYWTMGSLESLAALLCARCTAGEPRLEVRSAVPSGANLTSICPMSQCASREGQARDGVRRDHGAAMPLDSAETAGAAQQRACVHGGSGCGQVGVLLLGAPWLSSEALARGADGSADAAATCAAYVARMRDVLSPLQRRSAQTAKSARRRQLWRRIMLQLFGVGLGAMFERLSRRLRWQHHH